MVSTTFCVSGAVIAKAGDGAATAIKDGSLLINGDGAIDVWITQAESLININSRYDFTTNYATLLSGAYLILGQIASDLAAINAIAYDMSGYTSREEAKNMITTYRDSALRGLGMLRDKKAQDFINAT